ncbi:MAG: type 4a pilus biogenesis protein PilO [Desulfobulbaceae bacterium]|jgi:type IV pilus assembly protein PilO|nr:type 4a pilus biogenesis protein PilO [Desulfobulbaceae bacterium]
MAKKEKQISALTRFIDTRYIPMESRPKLGIALLLLAVPVVIYIVLFYMPYSQEMTDLSEQKIKLEADLATVRTKASSLQQIQKELAETQEIFDSKAELLPKDKEIPKLLKDISSLGTAAGLEFLSFKPMPELPKDFYEEIPITISLKGAYHDIGHFFDSVSKLERIVSVGDMKVHSPTRENNVMTLKADCQLVTYKFTNVEISRPQTLAGKTQAKNGNPAKTMLNVVKKSHESQRELEKIR